MPIEIEATPDARPAPQLIVVDVEGAVARQGVVHGLPFDEPRQWLTIMPATDRSPQ